MSDQTPRKRRWVMPLLGVSLAANLLVVGMAAGAFWRVKDMGAGKMRGGNSGAVYLRALDPEDRKAIFEELRSERDASRTADRGQRDMMLTALRADPFEVSKVEDILAQQLTQGRTARAAIESKWLEVVSQMTAADRATYADRLQEAFERRPHKRSKPQAD